MLGSRQRDTGVDTVSMVQMLLAQIGGLHGLMRRFQQSGLGSAMESWIGPGPNRAISATQIQQALGSAQLVQLSSRLGLDPRELAALLAQHLPKMVDSMTPEGRLPEAGSPQELGLGLKKDVVRH
jgi:uncharacterized protein YidB (DUF937 family)